LREITPEIHEAGAELVIVGNGSTQFAQGFVEDYDVTTPVFTDPSRELYEAVGARRAGFLDLFKPRLWRNGVRARRKGFRQHEVLGDGRQLGGVFIVMTDGGLAYRYLSGVAGDHPAPAEVLEALREAVAR
jgi:hypothetical protein